MQGKTVSSQVEKKGRCLRVARLQRSVGNQGGSLNGAPSTPRQPPSSCLMPCQGMWWDKGLVRGPTVSWLPYPTNFIVWMASSATARRTTACCNSIWASDEDGVNQEEAGCSPSSGFSWTSCPVLITSAQLGCNCSPCARKATAEDGNLWGVCPGVPPQPINCVNLSVTYIHTPCTHRYICCQAWLWQQN